MLSRHSLFVRTLIGAVAVAVCAVGATAWVAARRTTSAIRQQQGASLAGDSRVYDSLIGYAATHHDWAGVSDTVHQLARQTGRRIVLTTRDHGLIADSAGTGPTPSLANPTAVVDPLAVNVTLVSGVPADDIDPRAVGPFRLSAADRRSLRNAADGVAACLKRQLVNVTVVESPTGRPLIEPDITPPRDCPTLPSGTTDEEEKARFTLQQLTDDCLARQGMDGVRVGFDHQWRLSTITPVPDDPAAVAACFQASRKEQLIPYVAPAALLYLTDPAGWTVPTVGLSGAAAGQVALAALVILLLVIGVSAGLAGWLVRPVHALTAAVRGMRAGDRSARVSVRAGGEVGELTAAFNELSEHLQRTEEQRRSMAGDISHELRAPVSNLRVWLEAAQDGLAVLDQELVDSLLEETLLLHHLIDDLRDVTLADVDELRVYPEPLPLADILDHVTSTYRPAATAAGVQLAGHAPRDLVLVADPVRLRQALANLVSNAIRHTPIGGSVTIGVVAGVDGDRVRIEVRDTGAGIAPEDLPYVFDRFWRADKSRNRQTGGSGLGLAIVRGICLAHGGSVEATSAPGAGTTFAMTFPNMQASR